MNKPLFKDFPPVSGKQWKQKVQADLKGADYNDTLIWESPEGIHVKPFYSKEDLPSHLLNSNTQARSWKSCQSIFVSDVEKSNRKALYLLDKGVDCLGFIIPSTDVSLKKLLDQVPNQTPLYLEFQFLSEDYILSALDTLKERPVFYTLDIIGNLARSGNWFHSLNEDHKILEACFKANPTKTLFVNGSLYQNAGANNSQQLAYTLLHANEYLNHFQSSLDANATMAFHFSMGSNYFFEIAKLRAFRLLFASLAEEYNIDSECHITAIPTKRNKTLYDYNTNMLRTTTEYMSAILGGANTVYTLSYDEIYHKSNEFGERIARNQLLILKHESYFDFVDNPADGTYYIETLTQELASKALKLFKEIEANGGFLKQLKEGVIQKKIKESAQREQTLFDDGKLVLLGSNKHPNTKDKMKGDVEIYPFVKQRNEKTLIEPIIEKRLAENLEQNRLKTE